MGINFSLLAGGEPMMRKDILEAVAEVGDMIFPIFTNGTLIGPAYMEFLRKHLNMVPIISIEGTAIGTDERRGQVEYVPTETGTEHLAFNDEHVAEMEQLLEQRREEYQDIIFLSFPGDEKALGGCLASGRGFFHIGPDGSAEPCPFSPFSDSNVVELGVRGALKSPLFRKIRAARALGWEHTGGCTLFEHREEIEKMTEQPKVS